jgi:hypothetical protein
MRLPNDIGPAMPGVSFQTMYFSCQYHRSYQTQKQQIAQQTAQKSEKSGKIPLGRV